MKLTKTQIKQIIKEELEAVMAEVEEEASAPTGYDPAAAQAELEAAMAEPMMPSSK